MELESKFQRRVIKQLSDLDNCYYVKIQSATNGTPDLIICINGWSVHIELKRSEKRRPEKLQKYILDKIRRAKSFTFFANPQNWPQIYIFLEFLAENSPSNIGEINEHYHNV